MPQYASYSGYGGSGGGGGGVTSLNAETGAVVLVAGTGISVTPSGQNITIANTQSAFTPANLTDVGTDGIVITGGTNAVNGSGTSIAQHVADTTHNGYLSSTDWNTFNAKQPAGSYALQDLSNLTSPTSFNQTLLPHTTNTFDVGATGNVLRSLYVNTIADSSGVIAVQVLNHDLVNSAGAVVLNFSATDLNANTRKLINVVDPTNPQDAATKNYVDTHTGTGTVTSVSIVSANGLAGTVATATTTPAITLSTTITGVLQGNGTAISAATTTGSGAVVLATSPTLITPALGTPSALVGTNITGTAAGLTAGTVTTNANLTGDVTSVGNATSLVATTNSTLTTLSALSLPGSQVTGNISGNSANVTGIIAVANGGTSLATLPANNVILGNGTSTPLFVAPGTSGNILTSNGTTWTSTTPAASGITQLTGDVTAGPGSGSQAATLATVNSNVGSFGSSTSIPSFTVNAKGLITAASGNVVVAPAGTLSGTTLASNVVTSSLTSLGTQSVALNMGSHLINSVTDPVSAQDAATKNYVDNAVAGINPAVAVQAATTSAADTSGFTYNNGVSGIGATFTGSVNTPVVIDGFTFTTLGQRLLVKNDTQSPSGAFNGVYYVTQVQTALLAPILTRALDYDQPSDINNTGAIPVINGTVNSTTQWVLTSLVNTVGTDPLTFTQFARNPADYLLKANNLSDVANANTSFNNISPMTTVGDMIYEDATPKAVRLPIGTAGQFLQVVSGLPTWSSASPSTPSGEVWVYGPSNNTGVTVNPTFATIQRNSGSDITYAVDTVNGDTFTINTTGIYSISYADSFSVATSFGASLNGGTSTGIQAQPNANILTITGNVADKLSCSSVTSHLTNGDVVRANTQGNPDGALRALGYFHITRVS